MAIIVNTPAHEHYVETRRGLGTGTLMAGLLIVLLIIAVLYFAGPLLRSVSTGTQINVPRQVDVNVNTPQNGGAAAAPQAQ